MCAIRWFLLKCCIIGVYISVTETSVLLQTSDRQTTYVINSNVELVCTITPYNNEMTWYVDNDVYADCFLGACAPYSNKPYTFTFTFNENAGVFKLAIDSVNSSHADLSFACDNGTVRERISFKVTTVASESKDDSSFSEGEIAGIAIGSFIGLVLLIIFIYLAIVRPIKRYYLRKKTTEMNNDIRDIKQRLQKDDKQELLKQIENKELEEIQELKNRQEVIKGSLTEQSDEIKRNRRSLIKENDEIKRNRRSLIEENGRITEQLVFKEAQYNTRHSLFPMEGQDNIRYSLSVVDARNNTGHSLFSKEEQNQAQNKAIDEYIKEDLVNNGIFSTVIMQAYFKKYLRYQLETSWWMDLI